MAIQTVNIGTTPNDGTGDTPRAVGQKFNDNFSDSANAASKLVGSGDANVPLVSDIKSSLYKGTVSQSGGVPTGAVIERGSNVNGEYTKFADGTVTGFAFLASTETSALDSTITVTLPTATVSRTLDSKIYVHTDNSVPTNINVLIPTSTTSTALFLHRMTDGARLTNTQLLADVTVGFKGRWY